MLVLDPFDPFDPSFLRVRTNGQDAGTAPGVPSVVPFEPSTQPADSSGLGGMAAETADMRHMGESAGLLYR